MYPFQRFTEDGQPSLRLAQDFERAAPLRDRINDVAKELEKAEDEWLDSLA